MNVAKILGGLVKKLNKDKSCDLCWKFILSGRRDHFNLYRPTEDDACCVHVALLRNQFTTGFQSNENFTTKRYRDWNLEIFAGIPSRIDIQFHNEVDSEEKREAKFLKYIHPIFCCLQDLDTTICDVHGCDCQETTVDVRQWNMEMTLNFLDENYDGWLIRAVFREYLP